ncbi:MAG: ribosomal silencing factor RsfS [Bacillales bacterium]|jgi:ribosome-associated protein|nr:ribosomal silencing factor RsfS [Bacillales bacterium]
MDSMELAKLAYDAVDSKKAESIVCLKMQGISVISDYFIICHGNNEKQVQAIAKEVKSKAEEAKANIKRIEGYDEAKWVLVDIGDVVVHVFNKDERVYYNLEKLWGDAPQIQSQLGTE